MSLLDALTQPLEYDFMVRALVTTVAAAAVCAVLSCWLVLVGWSLMGDAVSHAVLPGVVLAYILGIPFTVGALVAGVLAVVLIGGLRGTSRVKEDASIGIVLMSLFALGLVLISVTPSQTNLTRIIFGNVLGISAAEQLQICALAVVALNFPLLLVWDRPASVLGLPLLGVAVFVIWAGLIASLIWVTERAPSPPRARTGVTDASLMPEAPAPAAPPASPTIPPEARR